MMRAFGPSLVRLLSWTWKTEILGLEHLGAAGERRPDATPIAGAGCMIALWHGRILLGVEFGRKRNWAVLVSPSADGDISVRLLGSFGYRVIRGSSSRGGARAVRTMLRELESGGVVVLTPDGPRGPRHSVNPGLAWLSRATGFPVVPMGLVSDRAWRLRSWDSFTIPKPFARVALVFGEPIQVPRKLREEEMAAAAELIRTRMFDCERRGLAHVGAKEDW